MKNQSTLVMCRTIFLVTLIILVYGCGEKSDSNENVRVWYCGPKHKPRAVKATLVDMRHLRISGKGAMMDYYDFNSPAPWVTTTVGEFGNVTIGYGGSCLITDLIIQKGVTHIGNKAFYHLDGLKSVSLPNSVKTIADVAFAGCTGLTSITLLNSVKTIGKSAFFGCTNLTSVTLPNSVKTIGDAAFFNCTGLTSITIPSNVTSIGPSAFQDHITSANDGCHDLSITVADDNVNYSSDGGVLFNKNKSTLIQYKKCGAYTIPNSVITIGEEAFIAANLSSITIPGSVKTIGKGAFSYCDSLTTVTIGKGVTLIREKAFVRCDNLTSVTIPNSVTSIEEGAFSNCFNLTSVTIPNSVISIEKEVFVNCSSLTSITISSSVTSIEENAFFNCFNLTSITIPNSVTTIGDYAFAKCKKLTSISVLNPAPPNIKDKTFYGLPAKVCLYVPANSVDDYRTVGVWNRFECIKAITAQRRI